MERWDFLVLVFFSKNRFLIYIHNVFTECLLIAGGPLHYYFIRSRDFKSKDFPRRKFECMHFYCNISLLKICLLSILLAKKSYRLMGIVVERNIFLSENPSRPESTPCQEKLIFLATSTTHQTSIISFVITLNFTTRI